MWGWAIVIGRDYFVRQAETLLKLAEQTKDPEVAASLIDQAADLKAIVDELGAEPGAITEIMVRPVYEI
jgi:hypothetical protein